MTIGRAACKDCLTITESEVETDVKCSGCGRVFRIPNAPQYTQPVRLRSRSLASLGSQLGIKDLFGDTSTPDSKKTIWEMPKISKQERSPKIQLPLFPEREKADVFEEDSWLWVIAQYPLHSSLEQIRRNIKDETLFLESALAFCPYKDTVEGLGVFTKIFEENLRNGILEVKLKE